MFTILCWFLPSISKNQPRVYICPLLSLPPVSHPTPQVVTEHWVEFPASHSKFPPAVYFTYGNVYVSMLYSILIAFYLDANGICLYFLRVLFYLLPEVCG